MSKWFTDALEETCKENVHPQEELHDQPTDEDTEEECTLAELQSELRDILGELLLLIEDLRDTLTLSPSSRSGVKI
jgi:hypothetical protein